MNNFIRAYGDFNNDLRTDYVAIGNNNYTTVFIFNTKSFIFEETNSFPPVQGCIPLNYYLCNYSLIQMIPTEILA